MPKPSRYTLIWSEASHHYELHLNARPECCFSSEDGLAFSRWLGEHTSFAFLGKSGGLSVVKEARTRGAGYWYAYRKKDRRTVKRYVGPSTSVTFARLEGLAHQLNPSSSAPAQGAEWKVPSPEREDVILPLKYSIPRLPADFSTLTNVVLTGNGTVFREQGTVRFTKEGRSTILAHTPDTCTWTLAVRGNTAELDPATQTCHLANGEISLRYWAMATDDGEHLSASRSGTITPNGKSPTSNILFISALTRSTQPEKE